MVHTWKAPFDQAPGINAGVDFSTYGSEKVNDGDIGELSKEEKKIFDDLPFQNISDTSSLAIASALENPHVMYTLQIQPGESTRGRISSVKVLNKDGETLPSLLKSLRFREQENQKTEKVSPDDIMDDEVIQQLRRDISEIRKQQEITDKVLTECGIEYVQALKKSIHGGGDRYSIITKREPGISIEDIPSGKDIYTEVDMGIGNLRFIEESRGFNVFVGSYRRLKGMIGEWGDMLMLIDQEGEIYYRCLYKNGGILPDSYSEIDLFKTHGNLVMRKSMVGDWQGEKSQTDSLSLLLNSEGVDLKDFIKYDSKLSIGGAMSGD